MAFYRCSSESRLALTCLIGDRSASSLAFLMLTWTLLLSGECLASNDDLRWLDGEWVYVKDLTAERDVEQMRPPMSPKFSFRVRDDSVILVNGHGHGHQDVPIALDRSTTEIPALPKVIRYCGDVIEGQFSYQIEVRRRSDNEIEALTRRRFRITPNGLVVHSTGHPQDEPSSVGLYLRTEDIPMPQPIAVEIEDLNWLTGVWVGARGRTGTTAIEERWIPPAGGAMLGLSRTVSAGKMSGFEYMRIVERGEGIVYIAQPGGGQPTEFVLTELGDQRAVFDNPRHDFPQRIVYELTNERQLRAIIGYINGGTSSHFEFERGGE